MLNENNGSSSELVDSIKIFMEPETLAQKIGLEKNILIEIGLYGAIGFLAGFLIKKYSEYFIAFVFLIIAIIILQQFDYLSLSFNNAKIHEFLGLQPVSVIGDRYTLLLFEWMKINILGTASFIVSFLIGLKVG